MAAAKSKGAAPGRPSAMTDEVVTDIVNALAAGATAKAAAGAAGISEATYHSWRAQACEGADPVFLEFLERTTRAREQGKVALAASIRKAANEGDWRAAAWLLERLEPEGWSLKQQLEHTGPAGGPIRTEDTTGAIDPRRLTREQRAALREMLDAQADCGEG